MRNAPVRDGRKAARPPSAAGAWIWWQARQGMADCVVFRSIFQRPRPLTSSGPTRSSIWPA